MDQQLVHQQEQQTKLQVVAKKLEKMLETALHQLKLEQKMRKEGEEKLKILKELESQKAALNQRVRFLETELEDRDARIIMLESKMANEHLIEEITSRDVELDRRENIIASLRKTVESLNEQRVKWEKGEERKKKEEEILTGVNAKVDQYEKRLTELIEKKEESSSDALKGVDGHIKSVGAHKNDYKLKGTNKNCNKNLNEKESKSCYSSNEVIIQPQYKENIEKQAKMSTVIIPPKYLKNKTKTTNEQKEEKEEEEVVEAVIKDEFIPTNNAITLPQIETQTFICGKRKRLPNTKYKDAYQVPKIGKKFTKKAKEDSNTKENKHKNIDLDEVLNEEWDQSQSNDLLYVDKYDGDGSCKYESEMVKVEAPENILNDDQLSESQSINNYMVGRTTKHRTTCKVCKASFQNRDFLTAHEKESGHDLRFECQYGCGKKFRQKIQCVRHEGQIHSTDMPFQCNRCQKKFKSEFSCKRHQENDIIHDKMENAIPFHKCEVCGKQFDRKRRWCLDQHMLTHLAVKQFPCEFCKKTFRQKSYLQVHRKFCIGIKAHECLFCGQRFSQKATLTNHERRHTGEKPYKCIICDEGFRTHNLYLEHGKKVHGAVSAGQFHELQDAAREALGENNPDLHTVYIEEGAGDVVSTFKDDAGDTFTVSVVPPGSVEMQGETIAIAVDENGLVVQDSLQLCKE